jgi:hypothetical protein
MNILVLTVDGATQAKVIIRPGFAVIKIPSHLSLEERLTLRKKLTSIVDANTETREFLKLYYKLGTPYLFLNRKLGHSKKETYIVYKWAEL